MLQYAVIATLIEFALHMVQIPDFATDKSLHPTTRITEPPSRLTVSVIRGLQLFHQLFTAHRPSYLCQRFRTLIHQSEGLFYCSLVQSLCALAHWSVLPLFCFIKSGFLTAILSYGSASQSHPFTVNVDTFFHDIGSGVQWCLEQSAFCHASWWLWWNCPLQA